MWKCIHTSPDFLRFGIRFLIAFHGFIDCSIDKLIITPDAEKAAMAKAEAEFMEKGMKKLQKRFQAEKEQLHAQFVAERNTEYNGREVQ